MNKELPKVYANKIDKDLANNSSYSYSRGEEEEVRKADKKEEKKNNTIEKNVLQKIDDIFHSPKYVYKANVIIETKEGKNTYKIIGKNYNNLITIDNELINIDDIIDIRFAD